MNKNTKIVLKSESKPTKVACTPETLPVMTVFTYDCGTYLVMGWDSPGVMASLWSFTVNRLTEFGIDEEEDYQVHQAKITIELK
jgi:hypothetical protein